MNTHPLKGIVLSLIVLIGASAVASAQTFSSLWKEVRQAHDNGLPQTEIGLLQQIETKAETEKAWGQLLGAETKRLSIIGSISQDSLVSEIKDLERKAEATSDNVLRAVRYAVLSKIYSSDESLGEGKKADVFASEALKSPENLAGVKAGQFEPLTLGTSNSGVFGGDLLSVVGYELGRFDILYKYYSSKGNRRAACIVALEYCKRHLKDNRQYDINKSPYIHILDSIIHEYEDVDVTGEAACERYEAMKGCKDVSAEAKMAYINYSLDHWSEWPRMGELRNERRQLTAPMFRISCEANVARPGESRVLRINEARNVGQLSIKIYGLETDGDISADLKTEAGYKRIKTMISGAPQQARTLSYAGMPQYQVFSDSMIIAPMPVGVYLIEVFSNPATETKRALYFVTDNMLLSEPLPQDKIRYVALSATSGKPLPNASIRLSIKDDEGDGLVYETLECDSDGEAIYEIKGDTRKQKPKKAWLSTTTDRSCPETSIYGSFSIDKSDGKRDYVRLYTDRSIYRPGQTIKAALVAYRTTSWTSAEPISGKQVTIKLRDANGSLVEEKKGETDEFGSCHADFDIPSQGLNGYYTIQTEGGSLRVRVEQYRKPSFKVEFPEVNTKYQVGDTLLIKAKAIAYSGMPVQGAKVSYKVYRREALWWRICARKTDSAKETLLMEQETITDGDGRFYVEFPLTLPNESYDERGIFYNIIAEASVTDISGETHSGEISVPIGRKMASISCSLGDKELGDSLKGITIYLKNGMGIDVNTPVKLRIDDYGDWIDGRTMVPITLNEKLKSGKHTLYALCDDDTLRHEFTVFSLDDTSLCDDTDDWFYVSSDKFPNDGSPVTVQVGSRDSDVHVVYSIISGEKIIESGSFGISNSVNNRKIEYKEEYGNGLLLTYAWVKNGICHTHSHKITKPQEPRDLRLSWTTFRDRLLPGQHETWTLNITSHDGKPANAQLMATLYDASLDQIAENKWTIPQMPRIPVPSTRWNYAKGSRIGMGANASVSLLKYTCFDFPHFDNSLFPQSVSQELYGGMSPRTIMRAKSMAVTSGEEEVLAVSQSEAEDSETVGQEGVIEESIRENFDETAMFISDARTDEKGNVSIEFTLPETLTTWRFIGLSHTKDICWGLINGETVAQKEVMTQPYMPRFVRAGDKARITAKVLNTGNSRVKGYVVITFMDAESGEWVTTDRKPFEADVDKTAAVEFEFSPDGSHPLLICDIKAEGTSGNGTSFSDGERHYLPILPDKERITSTKAFCQTGPGTEEIDLADLLKVKDETSRLTVEYTDNPIWMAIESLPYIGTTRDDNSMDQAIELYVSTIGKIISERNSELAEYIKQGENGRDSRQLISALNRNVELKDIIANETPWVGEAKNEEERMKQLADFFDPLSLEARIASAIDKLARLQNADGSWSWWQGMGGSTNLTAEIITMLSRLGSLTGGNMSEEQGVMLEMAMRYMDGEMADRVESLRKREENGGKTSFPGETALKYLYANSIQGRTPGGKIQENISWLTEKLKGEKSLGIYEKALAAIILYKGGDEDHAGIYAKSIREITQNTMVFGANHLGVSNESSWRNNRIAAHVAAMEALREINPEDNDAIDQMKLWLLNEKRAQMWETPIVSADAIWALLSDDDANLVKKGKNRQVVISIDGREISLPENQTETGYLKVTLGMNEGLLTKSSKSLEIRKMSDGTSWGAIYAQYMQESQETSDLKSGIEVKRDIIMPEEGMKVGAKVKVEITIIAERDLEFVQVIDKRAACMEPVEQLSGFRKGYYCTPRDNSTNYYFNSMPKGTYKIETEYFLSRSGTYETGTCTASCAYAPEYRATAGSKRITVKKSE